MKHNKTQSGDEMIIYLDVLVVINFCITYFSLKATAKLLHAGYRTGRLIAAAVMGGFSSLTALLTLEFIPSFMLKLFLTGLIALTAFGYGGFSAFTLRTIVTAVAGALVCGVTMMLRELTGNSFFGAAGSYPYLDISVFHLVISATAVYITISVYRRFCDKPQSGEMMKLIIKKGSNTAEILAYPDSGNNLRDFLTGLPVIVCRKDKISGLIPDLSESGKGVRIIPFSSAGGSGFITAFRADSITVCGENGQKTQIDALIGTKENMLENESFDAVINPKIIV